MAITIAEFDAVKAKVNEHELWIDGNGKEGAKTRLKTVERATESIEKKIDKMTSWLSGLVATVVGAIVIWVITNLLVNAQ